MCSCALSILVDRGFLVVGILLLLSKGSRLPDRVPRNDDDRDERQSVEDGGEPGQNILAHLSVVEGAAQLHSVLGESPHGAEEESEVKDSDPDHEGLFAC